MRQNYQKWRKGSSDDPSISREKKRKAEKEKRNQKEHREGQRLWERKILRKPENALIQPKFMNKMQIVEGFDIFKTANEPEEGLRRKVVAVRDYTTLF